ncbi:uncharacterized protein LOC109856038 isoform X2 [Pseudomyrmex gracilis]|uniref:uncharacterized protein LOC109856038 isoform X2 n=1 Tax=Pseudomyrmex gracilis TaxID=219809 RepID=UPI000994CE22|nr:uncharacterized protein LOC109856038 isoform X2 [Pseudomyrmex gracilis]
MQRHLVLSGATIARIVAIAGASLGVKSGVFPSEDCHRRRCQWVGRDTCGTQPRFNAGIMAQWKQDTILKLIGAYRERRFLWDKTAVEYTDRSKRYNAWKEIANEVRCDQVWSRYYLMLLNNVGFDVMTVERKLKSLKTHFMSVHKAYAKRRLRSDLNSGSVAEKPKWFAYEALTFLIKGCASRANRETIMERERQNSTPASNWKTQEISTYRDEFTVFAEHVAIRLKNIKDVRARLIAQHQINNILFEAEMGKYNAQTSYNSTASTEHLDEPSTSNDEKVIINIPQAESNFFSQT